MAQINANTRQTIWLSWCALVAAIVLGICTSRLLTQPIAALKLVAQDIAAGHLEQQVEPSGIRELDEVGHSFNCMATQLQESFAKLAYTAAHDALTGLPNRATFRQLLNEAIEQRHLRAKSASNPAQPILFAVLFLDLDDFKLINDSLGHLAGDQMLIETANRLRGCIQAHGHVARFGGDEFVILLDTLRRPSDVEEIVEEILSTVRKPFLLDDNMTVVSTSIGIAFSSSYATDADSMLRNADIALYRAKANGKAIYEVFEDEMHVEVMERLQLETDLRHALEQNALAVHYEPIVDASTLDIVSVEALLRWHHPKLGLVPPAKFIPIAKETGLIIPMGWWVLRTACQQARQWQQQFRNSSITVSVNLSSRQFFHPDLFRQVSQILRETGLRPQSLKLEITESLLIGERSTMLARLMQLKALGVQLSLDDFGTGFSALSYLHQFPLDTLKIDRSFVQQIFTDKQCQAIVESIVTMAHKLGMDVIAEGVETQEALAYLRDFAHCEQIQGFIISSALTSEEITDRIRRQLTVTPFPIEHSCYNAA
jgi:diguanylate cyclase (GGDEF)-like protein